MAQLSTLPVARYSGPIPVATPQPAPVHTAPAAVAPVATAPAYTGGFTQTQWSAIDAAVHQSLTGIGAGASLGTFAQRFNSALETTPGTQPDGLALTQAQITAVTQAYTSSDSHGAGFFEQGSSATPFYNAWDAHIHSLFSTVAAAPIAAPVASAAPSPIVVPPVAPIAPPPPPPSAPVAAITIAPPPTAPATPTASSNASDPTGLVAQVAALVTALQTVTTPTPAVQATTATAGPTDTATQPALGASSGNATTGAPVPSAADFASSVLAAAQNANVPGSGSVAGGVGYADTTGSGYTPLASTTTSSSGPDTTLIVVVLALVGVGAFVYFRFIRK